MLSTCMVLGHILHLYGMYIYTIEARILYTKSEKKSQILVSGLQGSIMI
jgi:hypothetical protein